MTIEELKKKAEEEYISLYGTMFEDNEIYHLEKDAFITGFIRACSHFMTTKDIMSAVIKQRNENV